MKYLIVIEKTSTGYSAYSPDLGGCVATGPTKTAVEQLMKEAVEIHLEGLLSEGRHIPGPRSYSAYLDVNVSRARPICNGVNKTY